MAPVGEGADVVLSLGVDRGHVPKQRRVKVGRKLHDKEFLRKKASNNSYLRDHATSSFAPRNEMLINIDYLVPLIFVTGRPASARFIPVPS